MNTVKFVIKKIIVVEVMLFALYFAINYFKINISFISLMINTFLKYLTPIAIFALILYFPASILTNKIIETIVGIVAGGIILYFILKYYQVI